MISPKIATINDLQTVVRMVKEFYNEEKYPFINAEIEKNLTTLLCEKNLGSIFLITDGSEIAGYCMVINSFCLELGGKIGYIDELFILNQYRNKKLSTNCLNYIIESYRLNNYATLRLEVEDDNPKAEELYKRFGFRIHSRKLMSYRL